MKSVTKKLKNEIKQYGRQIDIIITYNDGEEHLLDSDVLFSITSSVNGNILKSVMKQLDFESSVKVPKGSIINVKFGVQVNLSLTVAEVNAMKVNRFNKLPVKLLSAGLKGFEYINLGNYIVSKEPEYNADTLSYNHVCYDKMLYSMKDYEKLSILYPCTIREYINKICEYLGLTFKNANDTFANYNKQIKLDLYDGYNYTFRDILDELAQVTASTICINEETDELEIRYLNDTQDIIDEDYLKDVNVEFGKKYGPINSIVLSRAAESDNVFLQDKQSIQTNGLCELKIIDNQIMNDNDRSDFLPDILEKLNGLEYYINDFTSPGITWYELCDKYTVKIGENLYNCVLFNDEIKITQGLEENIYTEMPETSETDYSKADKTDRKINKAYIMVDKQNQKIESLISQQTETENKLTQVEQTVDGITQTVSEVEEKVETVETKADNAQETADNINTNLTQNYYTKTETNSQIQQTANSITSSVSASISEAKQEAIDSANSSTDNKLKDYSTTTEMNSVIEQKANEITTRIDEMQDITETVSGTKIITLQNCVPGALLELHIYGNNQVFKYLYPSDDLYPSNNLYPYGDSRIVVSGSDGESEESTSVDIYELGVTDVLRQNGSTRDEYVLKDGKAQVIRRINKDGTIKATEEIEDLGEFFIELKDVENVIEIKNYSAEIEAKYAIQNDYTDIYATKVEMSSNIKQSAEEINLTVSKKVGKDEVISSINQSAEEVRYQSK